jgi:hypothetical protein
LGALGIGGYGLWLGADSSYVLSGTTIAHNTLGSTLSAGAGIFVGANVDNGVVLKNNIIFNSNGGNVLEYSASHTGYIDSDYNIFYSSKTDPFKIGGLNYTFEDYKTLTGRDAHSIMLTSAPLDSNYRLTDAAKLSYHGALVISGVNDSGQLDMYGNATPTQPNIGHDQFDYAPGFGPWQKFSPNHTDASCTITDQRIK